MASHQRLSALDAAFLGLETPSVHMHVGALLTFEAGPLATADGGVDFSRICDYVDATLARMPRYRRRLEWIPGLEHPVWVDDEHFHILYHVRHTALPRPGDERQLKRLAGRIFSQKLDRTRPLWELWVVEGLPGGRFALIPKVHHCMIDGVAGAQAMSAMLRGVPSTQMPAVAPWHPAPAPPAADLWRAEIDHRVRGMRDAWRGVRAALGDMRGFARDVRDLAGGIASTMRTGLEPASPTPLDPDGAIGPHRRFDVCHLELGAVKRVKDRLGGKVNDVVLATSVGALRRFFARRGADPDRIDDFRAMVPVNIRRQDERSVGGNRVATLIARLPIDEPDPRRRLERVRETMDQLKADSRQVASSAFLEELSDITAASLIRGIFLAAGKQRSFNVVITNVPGPPFPLYLLGARLEAAYPLVPLFHGQSLGIALISYAGRLDWGLSADWQSSEDLHLLAEDLEREFALLVELAG